MPGGAAETIFRHPQAAPHPGAVCVFSALTTGFCQENIMEIHKRAVAYRRELCYCVQEETDARDRHPPDNNEK